MTDHPDPRPPPLVPAEVDLTDFSFMPLYIARLKQSKAWAYARRNPAIGFYLINLWTHAWHGAPAGSLEDDEMLLADAAQCNIKIWTKVSSTVLRSWIQCNDGRYYHPVIADIVLEAWQRKVAQHERTEAARRAKQQKRAKLLNGSGSPDGGVLASVTTSVTEPVTEPVTTSATTDVTVTVTDLSLHPRDRDRDRDSKRKKRESSLRSLSQTKAPDDDPAFDRFWTSYPRRVGKGQARRAFAHALRRTSLGAILAALERQHAAGVFRRQQFVPHPATWLNGERWLDDLPEHPDAAVLRAVGVDPDDLDNPLGGLLH
jgi:hypothetical protein